MLFYIIIIIKLYWNKLGLKQIQFMDVGLYILYVWRAIAL